MDRRDKRLRFQERYGRALLSAVEAEAARLGLTRIGLHVFGHNRVAIRFYETSGYVVTNLVMAKDLTPGAEDAAAKVRMGEGERDDGGRS
jgi:ribosomal protein S18 acetylase RimI-like enzyme